MDGAKRNVLVAALSAYAESLAKNSEQLGLEQGKGKGKVLGYDVDLSAEIQNQLNICGELTDTIVDAASGEDIVRAFGPAEVASRPPKDGHEALEGLGESLDKGPATKSQTGDDWQTGPFQDINPWAIALDQQTRPSIPEPQGSYVDNEPYIDPFTGSLVVPETGFEPGPSNKPP
ncbi:hypothetical protein GP486_008189, partial [Trichoglossum hirsutum]